MSDWALVEDPYTYINLDRVNYIQLSGRRALIYFAGQEQPLEIAEEAVSKLLSGKTIHNG